MSADRSPVVLVDVGARGGLPPHWQPLAGGLSWIAFEPDPEALREIVDPASSDLFLEAALYREPAVLDFHVTSNPRLSSLLRPERAFLDRFERAAAFDVVETRRIEADTLDRQLARHGITDVDFLKVDTQGSELYVLQGGEQILSRSVFGVEVEVGFAARYEGQPLFGEIDTHLQLRGFHLMDLRIGYWKREVGRDLGQRKGQMVLGEALYFRTPEELARSLAELADDSERRSKLLRAVLVCQLYGYLDYALDLLDQGGSAVDEAFRRAIAEQLSAERDGHGSWATVSSTRLGNLGFQGLFDYQPVS